MDAGAGAGAGEGTRSRPRGVLRLCAQPSARIPRNSRNSPVTVGSTQLADAGAACVLWARRRTVGPFPSVRRASHPHGRGSAAVPAGFPTPAPMRHLSRCAAQPAIRSAGRGQRRGGTARSCLRPHRTCAAPASHLRGTGAALAQPSGPFRSRSAASRHVFLSSEGAAATRACTGRETAFVLVADATYLFKTVWAE